MKLCSAIARTIAETSRTNRAVLLMNVPQRRLFATTFAWIKWSDMNAYAGLDIRQVGFAAIPPWHKINFVKVGIGEKSPPLRRYRRVRRPTLQPNLQKHARLVPLQLSSRLYSRWNIMQSEIDYQSQSVAGK